MTAKEDYHRADVLYREGAFQEALAILDALDQAHPGQQNIMFPRARCLAKLDRARDAITICDELIENFDFEKARELRSLILTQETVIVAPAPQDQPPPNIPGMETVLQTKILRDPEAPDNPDLQETKLSGIQDPVEERKPGSPWTKTVIVSAIVVVTIVASYFALFGLSE